MGKQEGANEQLFGLTLTSCLSLLLKVLLSSANVYSVSMETGIFAFCALLMTQMKEKGRPECFHSTPILDVELAEASVR